MNNIELGQDIIARTLANTLPDNKFSSTEAKILLLAIGLQESNFKYTRQIGGPARGYWQFEENGVKAVFRYRTTKEYVRQVCEARHVAHNIYSIYKALAEDNELACAMARLLLWTDPQKLPAIGDAENAWKLYAFRTWRPGKPRRDAWDSNYQIAVEMYQDARY